MKKVLSVILILALSASLLLGCTPQQEAAVPVAVPVTAEPSAGGVLCLKINPEIALHYDEKGTVTKVEGRNRDGKAIVENITGYEGQETSQVLADLVEQIGKAGYFVEEADGTARRITLELDPGSQVPHDRFLEDMAAHVKQCVQDRTWVGKTEYDIDEPSKIVSAPPAETVPATEPPVEKPVAETTPVTKPQKQDSTLCPVCADDDCDDGIYCDDWDDKAENQREAERIASGVPCEVCGELDCGDLYCDDWDEKYERDDDDDRWDD